MNDLEIQQFYELIGEHPPEFLEEEGRQGTGKNSERRPESQKVTNEQNEPEAQKQEKEAEHAFGTLEAFIDVLENSLKDVEENELEIYKRGSFVPNRHPNATKARPDAAIFRREHSLPQDEGKLFWSSIEMAIEYCSARKTRDQRLEQAATYVTYLLQARPDLISALGLLVERDSLDFFFCNTEGIHKLSLSKKENYLPLLSAVMRYLNGRQKKSFDPTLSRAGPTLFFDVSVPIKPSEGQLTTYPSCYLHCSHDPFGRRSSLFIYKPNSDVTAIRVIKDEYIRKNCRWSEKEILAKIHANGTYPAVVRMCFHGEISQARCGDRIRVRMCLQDYGTDFLSLKTPRDVIYALYDLLEVTRGLYFDRNILHCDISPWNIMIRHPEYTQNIETCPSTSPVFIQHLLNPQEPKHKSSIFLIDFGFGEDLDSSSPCSSGRTGTPRFIARAVQAGRPAPSQKHMYFPKLPSLSEGIRGVYESNYPQRVELFNGPLTPQFGPSKNPPPTSPFRHKLDHDGESGVWSAFWWGIQAFPEKEADVPINTTMWLALMPKYDGSRTGLPSVDDRDMVLYSLIHGKKHIFHPGYGDLLNLFQNIAQAILSDYHWAEDAIRQRPDFVHEILQRIILNFVVENKNAPFMDEKKASMNRTVSGITTMSHLSTQETGSCCSLSQGSSASSQSCKRRFDMMDDDPLAHIDALMAAWPTSDEHKDDCSDCHDAHDEDNHCVVKKPHIDDVPVIDVGTE